MRCFSRYAGGIVLCLFLFLVASAGRGVQPPLLLPLAMLLSMRGGAEFWGVFCGLITDIAFVRPVGFNIIFFLTACLLAKLIPLRYPRGKLTALLFLVQLIWTAADYVFFGAASGASAGMYLMISALSLPLTAIMCLLSYRRKEAGR